MNTWPISTETKDGWTFIGLPDRLGTGRPQQINDAFPTLEEIVGDDWSAQILATLLPTDRSWAWWTRTETYRATRLPNDAAPDTVDPSTLSEVMIRTHLIGRTTLAFIPRHDDAAKGLVTKWAGSDTEQAPEHIWVAPEQAEWSTDAIESWCRAPRQWSSTDSVVRQPVERIIVMFDQQIFCAAREAAAARTASALHELGRIWGLSVIAGPLEYAWAHPAMKDS